MADSGIKHIDVGAELTKVEWESEASHELVHGNSFPESPVERQLYYRDDEHKWYVYNGTSWVDLQGAGGGVTDHGELTGLADDDHPQYIKHSLATAVSNFLVASGAGVFIKKTLAEVKTILGLGTAAYTAVTDYITHALATAANDFLVASGSGAFAKKTLAEVKTLLDWAADIATHAGLTTGVHGAGAGTVGILNKDTKIIDADGDTGFEVEQSADEDAIRGKVAGVEAFLLSAAGILTLAKQALAVVGMSADQPSYLDASYIKLKFDTEVTDTQNEFNSRLISGTADATEAFKLHDADGGFEASDVGATIHNKTDNTYTTVAAFVDSGELTLTADIMVNTDTYDLYHAKWTCTEAGTYLVMVSSMMDDVDDGEYYQAWIYRNGSGLVLQSLYSSGASLQMYVTCFSIYTMAATDYVEAYFRSITGTGEFVESTRTYLYIVKLV